MSKHKGRIVEIEKHQNQPLVPPYESKRNN